MTNLTLDDLERRLNLNKEELFTAIVVGPISYGGGGGEGDGEGDGEGEGEMNTQ